MNRKETTALLSKSLLYHINPKNDPRIYWAREVSFDNATTHRIRVDFMKFVPVNNSVSGMDASACTAAWRTDQTRSLNGQE